MEYGFVYQAVARWKRFHSSGKKMMKLMNVLKMMMMIWLKMKIMMGKRLMGRRMMGRRTMGRRKRKRTAARGPSTWPTR